MTISWKAAAALLAAAGAAIASQSTPPRKGNPPTTATPAPRAESKSAPPEKKTEKKEKPPFYEQYLSAELPLDQAIREAAHRVQENPKSAALRNDFGNVLARRGFAKEALAQYARAVRLDRAFYLADYNAGLVYEKEGKEEHAINAFRRSIRKKPGFPPSRFHLGLLYERRGQERAAIGQYAKALRIDDSLRQPARNPLVVQTRLLYRVSLENYQRDLAAATQAVDAKFAQPELFKKIALDRPVDTEEVKPPEEEEQAQVRPATPAKWTQSASTAPRMVQKPVPPRPAPRPVPPRPQPQQGQAAGVKGVSPRTGTITLPVMPGRTFIPPAAAPPPAAQPPATQTPAPQAPEEPPPSGEEEDTTPPPF